jgi:hypothetical protein
VSRTWWGKGDRAASRTNARQTDGEEEHCTSRAGRGFVSPVNPPPMSIHCPRGCLKRDRVGPGASRRCLRSASGFLQRKTRTASLTSNVSRVRPAVSCALLRASATPRQEPCQPSQESSPRNQRRSTGQKSRVPHSAQANAVLCFQQSIS